MEPVGKDLEGMFIQLGYKLGPELGKGRFNTVYSVTGKNEKKFAVKVPSQHDIKTIKALEKEL